MKIGFDNQKYLKLQSERILERVAHFGGKLYLEFGGKLFDDYHASRVLPGFQPDSKMKVLLQLKEQAEIVIAINAAHIEMNKRRGDLGITYDLDVMRLIDTFRSIGLYVGSVVITQYAGQQAAEAFQRKLEALGVRSTGTTPSQIIPQTSISSSPTRAMAKTSISKPAAPSSSSRPPAPARARWRPASASSIRNTSAA